MLYFKSHSIVERYGLKTLWALYGACAARLLLVAEFHFAVEVPFVLLNPLAVIVDAPLIVGSTRYHVGTLLALIWLLVAAFLMVKEIVRYFLLKKRAAAMSPAGSSELRKVLYALGKKETELKYVLGAAGTEACFFGIRQPVAVIPADYTGPELEHLIAHMEMHHKRHDLPKRLLVKLILDFFWWMPWLRLAEENVFMMLESACDRDTMARHTTIQRGAYLETMTKVGRTKATPKMQKAPVICESGRWAWTYQEPAKKKRPWAPVLIAAGLFAFSCLFVLQSYFTAPMDGGGYVGAEAVADITYVEPYYFWYALHDGETGTSTVISKEEKEKLLEEGVPLIQVK